MFSKLFSLGLLAVFVVAGYAQTPEPRKDSDRAFFWQFDDGSYLGVQTTEVNRENFARFGLRDVRGVAVEKVIEGSPAQAAGLQAGDVIVRFNGQEVGSSRMLTRLINEVSPDHGAKVTVLRGGSERELNVTMGKRPTPKWEEGSFNFKFPDNFPNVEIPNIDIPKIPPMPKIDVMPNMDVMPNFDENFAWHFGSSRQIGVSLVGLTKQLADSFGVAGGAMISEVRENSPAAKAGLKAGDIITEVDGKSVKGNGDLMRAMSEKKEGDVTLTVVRNGNRQMVKVTPEPGKGGFEYFYEGPEAPRTPGTMNLIRPNTHPAPMPLNQLMVPGRVI
ncbi:MAG: PDZ domain-containing protein [Pyrinomonadaceae bacterium]